MTNARLVRIGAWSAYDAHEDYSGGMGQERICSTLVAAKLRQGLIRPPARHLGSHRSKNQEIYQ